MTLHTFHPEYLPSLLNCSPYFELNTHEEESHSKISLQIGWHSYFTLVHKTRAVYFTTKVYTHTLHKYVRTSFLLHRMIGLEEPHMQHIHFSKRSLQTFPLGSAFAAHIIFIYDAK